MTNREREDGIQVNQTADTHDAYAFDADQWRVNNWLLHLGNYKAWDQIQNDPTNARYRELVRKVADNLTFQVINEAEEAENKANNFNWLGHDGLEKDHDERLLNRAKQMRGTRRWRRDLRNFKLT